MSFIKCISRNNIRSVNVFLGLAEPHSSSPFSFHLQLSTTEIGLNSHFWLIFRVGEGACHFRFENRLLYIFTSMSAVLELKASRYID